MYVRFADLNLVPLFRYHRCIHRDTPFSTISTVNLSNNREMPKLSFAWIVDGCVRGLYAGSGRL